MEAKMIKMQKTKEEIEEFHKERELWKQKEKEELEEENRYKNKFFSFIILVSLMWIDIF